MFLDYTQNGYTLTFDGVTALDNSYQEHDDRNDEQDMNEIS